MRAKLIGRLCVAIVLWLGNALQAAPFSTHMLEAVQSMPSGGGYASDRAAELRFAARGVVWDASLRDLQISAQGASPSFCSAACYMVLLKALKSWEKAQGRKVFSPAVWQSLRVEPVHPDGYLNWGRMNANGPGCAKWIHDLGAGVNFTAVEAARPGDLLKFFHTEHIGARERGHLVIFLGIEHRRGVAYLRFWSANQPGGYGEKCLPLRTLHHLIFTRITRPERFVCAPGLPEHDPWLASMLQQSYSFADLVKKCAISSTPSW